MCAVFTALVLQTGIPELRHDWWWPRDRNAFTTLYEAYASGWFPFGIGAPDQYPQKYVLAEILYATLTLSSSIVALGLYAFLTALVVVRGAMSLSGKKVSFVARFAVAAFALFNPWVYNKIVAGHVSMILAYGAMMFLVAELERPDADWRRLALAFVGAALHLQFAVLAICALAVDAVLRRRIGPLGSALVLCSPSLIGILGDYSQLRGSPQNFDWFAGQSVRFVDALALRGYFTQYDALFSGLFVIGPVFFGLLALVGTLRDRSRPWTVTTAALVLIVVTFVSGVNGPAGSLLRVAVNRFPEIGLFRELYDLVAFIAIGYIVLARRNLQNKCVAGGALVSAFVMIAFWLVHGPSANWVGSTRFERIAPPQDEAHRYALLPGIQPFSFRGEGSGADPDTVDYGRARQPINEVFPSYPIDVALARVDAGDDSELEALGVGSVYERSGFAAVDDRLGTKTYPRSGVRSLHPAAIVSIGAFPTKCSLCTDLEGGNVFFGDEDGSTISVPGTRDTIDETREWVDARPFFRYTPALGQSFGGAFTTSSTALLSLRPAQAVLAYVSGVLRESNGRIVARGNGGGYRWYAISGGSPRLRCEGRCAIALEGPKNAYPTNGIRRQSRPVDFLRFNPWFVRVKVPPHVTGVIRFRERFDAGWLALSGVTVLRHLRIDALFNGWFITTTNQARTIFLVEAVAFEQFVCECFASLWVVVLTIGLLRGNVSEASRRILVRPVEEPRVRGG